MIMAYYSYFAYFVMLITLLLSIRFSIEALLFRRALREQYKHNANNIKRGIPRILLASESIPIRYYINAYKKQGQLPLQDQIDLLFAPFILKLNSIKAIAPALGLFFTVLSIIFSFSIFAESGDIKEMFSALATGLGTTALGALTIVLSKIIIDRVILPCSLETLEIFHQQKSLLVKEHPLKRSDNRSEVNE